MLDAARHIQRFASGVSPQQYLQNEMMQFAVERMIEVIGEAARKVSNEFKQAHPEIPWKQIIAQRNVIAHEYGTIIHSRIWLVVETGIPALIALLEPLIPPLPQEDE